MEGKGVGVEEGLEFQGFLNRRQKINFTKSEYVISKAKMEILTTLLNGMLKHRFQKHLTYCHYQSFLRK